MVQFPNSGDLPPESVGSPPPPSSSSSTASVKLEFENPIEEEDGSLNKRLKTDGPFHQFPNSGNNPPEFVGSPNPPSSSSSTSVKLEFKNSIEEEDRPLNKRLKTDGPFHELDTSDSTAHSELMTYPLGLTLRKTPSLLDLVQLAISAHENSEGPESRKKKDHRPAGIAATAADKLKASNFPVSLLRIGSWEVVSRYEWDLVAKCYFAKQKLVWEVLDGGLKNKIEIQWSDITALKANCPENGPGTLDIVLARQPLFFRESNPQPRKHTIWQATTDFTGGEASMYRRHLLQCPQVLLKKHFEKLIQCDTRLNLLSQQPEVVLKSPYFEPKCSALVEPNDSKCNEFVMKGELVSTFRDFQGAMSTPSTLKKSGLQDPLGRIPAPFLQEPSPSSVMDSQVIEENTLSEAEEPKNLNQRDLGRVPNIHGSVSMVYPVNYIGHHIPYQMSSSNPRCSREHQVRNVMEDIKEHLLSDNQQSLATNEKSLMPRVDSWLCLLKNDLSHQNFSQMKNEGVFEAEGDMPESALEAKPQQPIPREDSLGSYLLNIPRIQPIPQILGDVHGDSSKADQSDLQDPHD
ncbi:hypothetical protein QJS04_geneDACA013638 [Acorus gramineus]|uniref:TRF2/HOY1 PH-like domain-containing protein n=1 Tax=Acorus gramineus TaxID=55184 RepID=A0AAV9AWS7_ACOGR|nr:hypothetical protein QJS04_geneDACA013638 [Acorus gramineus]